MNLIINNITYDLSSIDAWEVGCYQGMLYYLWLSVLISTGGRCWAKSEWDASFPEDEMHVGASLTLCCGSDRAYSLQSMKVESEDVCISYWVFSAHSCIQSSCWRTGSSSWKLSSSSCWMYSWAQSNSSVKSGTWFSAACVTRKRWYEWNQFAKNAE